MATKEEFNNGIFNVEVKGKTMAETFKRMSDNGFDWSTENSGRVEILDTLLLILIPDSISYGAGNVSLDSDIVMYDVLAEKVSGDFDLSDIQSVVDWINEHVVKFTCIANGNNDDYSLTLNDMVLTTK